MGRKILVAIELDDLSADSVLRKAASIVLPDDNIAVLHVVDPRTVGYVADPSLTGEMFLNNYENALAKARQRVEELSKRHGFKPAQCRVRYGRIAHEIHELLHEENFDVLMIGSHGWSGWRRLLGSQAVSILHGVPVDTWVFKVDEKP